MSNFHSADKDGQWVFDHIHLLQALRRNLTIYNYVEIGVQLFVQ